MAHDILFPIFYALPILHSAQDAKTAAHPLNRGLEADLGKAAVADNLRGLSGAVLSICGVLAFQLLR